MITVRETSRTAVKIVICLGAFLSNLSAGMFNIALVDISADLSFPLASAQWVVSIYLLVISVLLPVMGRLGDLYGRRNVHNVGLLVFAVGALGCALSLNFGMLLGFRVLQGLGASMYQATNMALIVSLFPKEQRGRALGLMSTFVAAGSMAGPGLGGLLTQWLSWHSNFWLLALIAGAAWLTARLVLPADEETRGGRLDTAGAAGFAVCLTSLMTAVDLGGRSGFLSWSVLLLAGVGVLSGIWFAAWCLSSRWSVSAGEPFVELRLFRSSGVLSGIVVTIITYMAAFTVQLALPVYLRTTGTEAAWAGLIMIGYPLALVISAPFGGSNADRKGPMSMLIPGLALMSVTLMTLGVFAPMLGQVLIVLPIVLLGCSMGMITSPNTSIVMGFAPKAYIGTVSSILALCRNIGMMLGTAVAGLAVSGGTAAYPMLFLACGLAAAMCCGLMAYGHHRKGRNKSLSNATVPRN